MICITTASLVSTPDSTIAVEDTVINIEDTNNNTQKELTVTMDNSGRLKGYFCSDVVFNVSHKVLSDLEISVLGKGLGFSPTPTFINEEDLRRDFAEFARKMRCKWFFRNEITQDFSEAPAFRVKSNWNPPKDHSALEMFLSQV